MPNLEPWTQSLLSTLMGQATRTLPQQEQKRIYLSFDDGPDPENTAQVLDLLREFGAKATFFIVAQRAEENPKLLSRILKEGHAVGNHSLDHRYAPFFKGYTAMRRWIEDSEKLLSQLGVEQSVGFRPPVGIRTPELARALRDLEIPLILWKQRSFDGIRKFNNKEAKALSARCSNGDIVLLHDRQRAPWRKSFNEGLGTLIESLKRKDFTLAKMESFKAKALS